MAKAGQADERRKQREEHANVANARIADARTKLLEAKQAAILAEDTLGEALVNVALDVVNRVFAKAK